jgi:uncharacterized protein (TIGR00369 family)
MTAEAWRAELEEKKRRYAPVGVSTIDEMKRVSGLEFLRGIVEGRVPPPPMSQTLNFYLIEVAEGRAVFQGEPEHAFYNPIGTVHGGWHATLLDSAMACAVHTLVEPGSAYATLEFKIHCVRPLTDRCGPVQAEGKVVAAGRRTATAEGRLVDAEGRLYSHGTTTCLFIEAAG